MGGLELSGRRCGLSSLGADSGPSTTDFAFAALRLLRLFRHLLNKKIPKNEPKKTTDRPLISVCFYKHTVTQSSFDSLIMINTIPTVLSVLFELVAACVGGSAVLLAGAAPGLLVLNGAEVCVVGIDEMMDE